MRKPRVFAWVVAGLVATAPPVVHAVPAALPTALPAVGSSVDDLEVVPVADCTSDDDLFAVVPITGNEFSVSELTVYAVDATASRLGTVDTDVQISYHGADIAVSPAEWPGYTGVEVVVVTDTDSGSLFADVADEGCSTTTVTATLDGRPDGKTWTPSLTPISPTRVFDSRTPVGGSTADAARVSDVTRIDLLAHLSDPTLVPSAVIANVTAVDALDRGFVSWTGCHSVAPGEAAQSTSLLNYRPGERVANQTVIPVSRSGEICLYTRSATHLIVDVTAMVHHHSIHHDGPLISFPAIEPTFSRRLDTREPGTDRLTSGGEWRIDLGSGAEMITLTVVDPDRSGHLRVYPCADGRSGTSVLNYRGGDRRAATVLAVGDERGELCVYSTAATDLVVDGQAIVLGAEIVAIPPVRLADTRPGGESVDGGSVATGRVGQRGQVEIKVAGRGPIPPDATAAQLTVTVADPAGQGHTRVFPCDSPLPTASTSNYQAGQNVANHALVPLSESGTVCVWSLADADIVVDVEGYLPAEPLTPDVTLVKDEHCYLDLNPDSIGQHRLTPGQPLVFSEPLVVFGGFGPHTVSVDLPDALELEVVDDRLVFTPRDFRLGNWSVPITVSDQADSSHQLVLRFGTTTHLILYPTC